MTPVKIGDATIHHGDVRAVLATLTSESVQTVVTSPPYWGLRDYGVEGQIGLEATPEELLDERDHRRLAEVVGPRLEGEAEDADALASRGGHEVEGARDLQLVAGERPAEHGGLDVERPCTVGQAAQVLREAGAAEGEARLEVGR